MKLSVALCTYNGEKYIQEQLDSILNQTKKIDEIIICDDISTDNTESIIKEYQNQHPYITFIKNPSQLGVVKNFEKAIENCSGDIIFLSDQDDRWIETKVEKIVTAFENNPQTLCFATNGFIMDENSEIDYEKLTAWDIPKILKQNGEKINHFELISCYNNYVTGASMAFKKELIPNIKNIPFLKKVLFHDEWIALKASVINKFDFIDEKLFVYRVHSSQQVGGVSYENSQKKHSYFKYVFSNKTNIKSLYYKRKLKLMSKNYKKFKDLKEKNSLHKDFINSILDTIKSNYSKTIIDFKKEHILDFYIMSFLDFFTKKRKINE